MEKSGRVAKPCGSLYRQTKPFAALETHVACILSTLAEMSRSSRLTVPRVAYTGGGSQ